MRNNINIEEIKLLIPDYIKGLLNDEEKQQVEEAISFSSVLDRYYREMKNTLDFVGSVKYEEPIPQYWNNLLPRIHQRLEERNSKTKARNPIAVIWKALVPAAAVILIFVVYKIVTAPGPEFNDNNKIVITNESKKDTVSIENKQKEDIKEEKVVEITNEPGKEKTYIKKNQEQLKTIVEEENIVEKPEKEEKNIEEKEDVTNGNYTNLEFEEALILGAGEMGFFDEEMENELGRLNKNQQNLILEELSKSNL